MYGNGFTPRKKGRGQDYLGNKVTQCLFKHTHRSKLEAAVCHSLHARKQSGEIRHIETEVKISLTEAKIGYIVDFKCMKPDLTYFFCEAKGRPNDTWSIKKRLWRAYGPAPLYIYTGHYNRIVLEEVIEPLNAPAHRM